MGIRHAPCHCGRSRRRPHTPLIIRLQQANVCYVAFRKGQHHPAYVSTLGTAFDPGWFAALCYLTSCVCMYQITEKYGRPSTQHSDTSAAERPSTVGRLNFRAFLQQKQTSPRAVLDPTAELAHVESYGLAKRDQYVDEMLVFKVPN